MKKKKKKKTSPVRSCHPLAFSEIHVTGLYFGWRLER